MASVDHLLIAPLDRESGVALRTQIERQLRAGIRDGRLHPGTRLPSTRALAGRLGVARGVVVEAYSQLSAEGWLVTRQRSGTRVARGVGGQSPPAEEPPRRDRTLPYDFRLGVPDLAAFPRAAWAAAVRRVVTQAPDSALSHPDPRGAAALRTALAAYLGRVRGVVTTPDRVVVTAGFWQGLACLCGALAGGGARRIGMEDPGFVFHRHIVERAGLEPVPVPIDTAGLRVDRLDGLSLDAVLVTPAHQSPLGMVLAPERRSALIEWSQRTGAVVIEDDYDAEHRYDREPVGALQGLAPEQVAYGGTASKTLSPALRLGWLALPAGLAGRVAIEKALADGGCPTLEQLALADLLERGELDRHLRRTRSANRRKRDALAEALAEHLPEARLRGVAAGLHAAVELPGELDERAVVRAAAARGVRVEGLAQHRFEREGKPPMLLLGYASLTEQAIRRGVAELAVAVGEAKPQSAAPPPPATSAR